MPKYIQLDEINLKNKKVRIGERIYNPKDRLQVENPVELSSILYFPDNEKVCLIYLTDHGIEIGDSIHFEKFEEFRAPGMDFDIEKFLHIKLANNDIQTKVYFKELFDSYLNSDELCLSTIDENKLFGSFERYLNSNDFKEDLIILFKDFVKKDILQELLA